MRLQNISINKKKLYRKIRQASQADTSSEGKKDFEARAKQDSQDDKPENRRERCITNNVSWNESGEPHLLLLWSSVATPEDLLSVNLIFYAL